MTITAEISYEHAVSEVVWEDYFGPPRCGTCSLPVTIKITVEETGRRVYTRKMEVNHID